MQSQLFDLMQLRFDPVDVMFLVNDDMFEQLTGGVVLMFEARFDSRFENCKCRLLEAAIVF